MDWTSGEFDLLRFSGDNEFEQDGWSADDDLASYSGFRRTPPTA
jgi:hypothetical protein